VVRASEANAAGLEAAAGDGRAEGCDAESRAGEHLNNLISATHTLHMQRRTLCVGGKLVQ
jgi:hypothetical protein